MKKKLLYALALALSMTTGCGPALQPFFTSSDLSEDPALEGRWKSGDDMFEFRHVQDSHYTVLSCEPECKDPVPVTMFRLNGQTYLDFQESKPSYSSAIYPHGVIRLRVQGDEVESSMLDDDALRAAIHQKRVILSHVMLDKNRLLVTAPTAKLQQFLSRYGQDPQLWTDKQTYLRIGGLN
jgi:hypothetical protein